VWTNIEEILVADPPPQDQINEVVQNIRRRAKARFYADENFPGKAANLLRATGSEVRTARQAHLLGHPDENHWAYARRHKLALLSCDRDFLDERRFPLMHSPAIFVFDFGAGSEHEIRLAFRCLKTVLSMPQLFDKWWKYDARRDGWTVLARHQNGTSARERYRLWAGQLQIWT
jgi:predicted nuclease of predicted toxin-antitoxin system